MKLDIVLTYNNIDYPFQYDFSYPGMTGDDDDRDGAVFMFEEGNFSCDCNKSIFIREYVDSNFPEMLCGDKIQLKYIKVVEERNGQTKRFYTGI